MSIFPTEYSREQFIDFLKKNHENEIIIEKFKIIPENIKKNNYIYRLYIVSTLYNTDDIHYDFELNYYSEEQIEFLFSFKVFINVEDSINNLICDLFAGKYIKRPKNLK